MKITEKQIEENKKYFPWLKADFEKYENLLNKKTKRKNTKSVKKEAPKTEEKHEENVEAPKSE